MSPEARKSFIQTTYKRLYYQGYTGRVALFSWPTTMGENSIWSAVNNSGAYNRGEEIAWHSASRLQQLLLDLESRMSSDAKLSVLAHSQGNVVASEALRLLSSNKVVDTYLMSQAALLSHLFDGTTDTFYIGPSIDEIADELPYPGQPGVTYWDYPGVTDMGGGASNPRFHDIDQGGRRIVNLFNPLDFALEMWQINQQRTRALEDLDPLNQFTPNLGWAGDAYRTDSDTGTLFERVNGSDGSVIPITQPNNDYEKVIRKPAASLPRAMDESESAMRFRSAANHAGRANGHRLGGVGAAIDRATRAVVQR